MTYYEIKKVFSKRGSKIALGIIFAVVAVALYFIIGENEYVNQNGDTERGFAAISEIRKLKKEWTGELTEDVIRKVIEENKRIRRHRKHSQMIFSRMTSLTVKNKDLWI